jgi:hypothetical protein
MFGNWREVPPTDFVTNIPVHRWYSGFEAENFRPNLLDSLTARLNRGETVTVGVDYYALNLSRSLLPEPFIQQYGDRLISGGVVRFKLTPTKDGIMMEVI